MSNADKAYEICKALDESDAKVWDLVKHATKEVLNQHCNYYVENTLPLLWAIGKGDPEHVMILYMIYKGADVNKKGVAWLDPKCQVVQNAIERAGHNREILEILNGGSEKAKQALIKRGLIKEKK